MLRKRYIEGHYVTKRRGQILEEGYGIFSEDEVKKIGDEKYRIGNTTIRATSTFSYDPTERFTPEGEDRIQEQDA